MSRGLVIIEKHRENVDIDKVKELVDLMVENDLVRISLRSDTEEITLQRPGKNEPVAMPVSVLESTPALPAPNSPPQQAGQSNGEPKENDGLVPIHSPMVGTSYASSHPGADPFVKVGSQVVPDTIVCIIEAMKVFNEIRAEVTGTIEKILVGNEHAVEYGQPLFLVRPG